MTSLKARLKRLEKAAAPRKLEVLFYWGDGTFIGTMFYQPDKL